MMASKISRMEGGLPITVSKLRTSSELLTAESKRLVSEVDKASKRMQQDAKKTLEQRIRDIQFLRQELKRRLEEILWEIDALTVLKTRMEKALKDCTDPLKVTMLCLEERTKRAPVEQVCDEVERDLLTEREVFEGVTSLLQHTLERIVEQIRLNRSVKYHLEKDLKGKFQAQTIDDSCTLMSNHSFNNDQRSKDSQLTLPRAVSPEEWEDFSGINISRAEQEKANSASLRAFGDSVLEKTASDMQNQLRATASAFQLKIQETKTAKKQMEDHLASILSELSSQERNMEALQEAIAEKEIPLGVAQARLAARTQRPGTEQCHDSAQERLLAEVQELTAHINRMREAATRSAMEQKSLIRCQRDLQENIEVKASSLYIDDVLCGQHREPIVIRNV